MNKKPDLSKVAEYSKYFRVQKQNREEIAEMLQEAKRYLEYYDWCAEILEVYAGIVHPGIIGVFLFRIRPAREDVDEWTWVMPQPQKMLKG